MKADRNNFQFKANKTEESDAAVHKLELNGIARRDGYWFGKSNGDIFHNLTDMLNIPIVTPSEALALLQPFDRNNFCVDIRAEQDSPLLPKFKEWIRKIEAKLRLNEDAKYWGLQNSLADWWQNLSYSETHPLTTLSALRQHYPEIWEGEKDQELVIDKEYEFEAVNDVKFIGKYIGISSKLLLPVFDTDDGLYYGKNPRPIRTLRDEIEDLTHNADLTPDELTDRIMSVINKHIEGRKES